MPLISNYSCPDCGRPRKLIGDDPEKRYQCRNFECPNWREIAGEPAFPEPLYKSI